MRGRDEGGVVGGDQEGPGSTARWVVVSLERDERITQKETELRTHSPMPSSTRRGIPMARASGRAVWQQR